jgi:hypothetical protein
MSVGSARWGAWLAFIAAVAVLAPAVPALASSGPRYASAEQAGYAATGAQFRDVQASVYLRNPVQYAGEAGQYSDSVQLWSAHWVAVAGLSASTSGPGYTPYAEVFDTSSHQLVVSDPNAVWCIDFDQCGSTIGSYSTGDNVMLSVDYAPDTGHLTFVADDTGPDGFDTGHLLASYTINTGESFSQARAGTEFGPDPWTAPPSFTHPAAWTKIAVFSGVQLRTYNGKTSTLASWFVHHKIFMAGITGSLIDVEAAPADLTSAGASFQDWLAPAGVTSPLRSPRA